MTLIYICAVQNLINLLIKVDTGKIHITYCHITSIPKYLSLDEWNGLKSLCKRVSESELVVVPTDKTGKFCVMSRETYVKCGMVHCKKDLEIPFEDLTSTQKDLNGNTSMLVKIFRMGSTWDQVGRVRETVLNHSLEVCPLSLLYKDHKGWDLESGKIPPTRPLASGNRGMNLHLSEIISEVVEPVADTFKSGFEVNF